MNERNEKTAEVQDQAFASKAKEVFDESVHGLDAEAQSRLNRARHEALAHAGSGVSHSQWLRWAPATGVAAAAVVAVVVLTGRPPIDELTPPATVSDFEILLDQESFEMLEELEFYSWIDLEVEGNGNVG
jgi:uncharacterized glyoxalase superfamily metalloenzyme YdcJ